MRFERRRPRHSHLDIAPLVDVVFLLLLFFMLTFQMTATRSLSVELPASNTAEASDADALVVTMDAHGVVHLGQDVVRSEDLRAFLAAALSARPDQRVRIVADKNTRLDQLVSVIDAVRHGGAAGFDLLTKP